MKRIPLTQGKYAIVDDEDYERINQFKWCAHYDGRYWCGMRNIKKRNGGQKSQYMHRFITDCPKGLEVDHRNHDTLDNQKCNLRICTCTENRQNQIPRQRKTGSKYKGVYWNKQNKKWGAQIQSVKNHIYLGLFINEINAAQAYDKKAKELFGEFAYLNFQQKGG